MLSPSSFQPRARTAIFDSASQLFIHVGHSLRSASSYEPDDVEHAIRLPPQSIDMFLTINSMSIYIPIYLLLVTEDGHSRNATLTSEASECQQK